MPKNQFAVLILFTFMGLSACVEVVDNQNQNAESVQAGPNKPHFQEWFVSEPTHRMRAIPAKPNQYLIQISNSAVRQINFDSNSNQQMSVLSSDGQSTSYQINGGTSLSLQTDSGLIQVQVPQDLVINQLIESTDSNTEIKIQTNGRIFLGPAANLISFRKKLILSARELIFDRTILQNYTSTDRADINQEGQSGGDLILNAEKISGQLYVELRGQMGGKGLAGADFSGPSSLTNHQPGAKGSRGRSGGFSGNLILNTLDLSEAKIEVEFFSAAGGSGGEGGRGQQGINFGGSFSCTTRAGFCSNPGEGNKSGPSYGPRGETGEPGKSGQIGQLCFAENNQLQCLEPEEKIIL